MTRTYFLSAAVLSVTCMYATAPAETIPYEVVVTGREDAIATMYRLNLDPYQVAEVPDPPAGGHFGLPGDGHVVAIDPEGSIVVPYNGPIVEMDGLIYPTVEFARFDAKAQQWEITQSFSFQLCCVMDVEIAPDEKMIISEELGISVFDPETQILYEPASLVYLDISDYGHLGIDSSGNVIFTGIVATTFEGLFRYQADTEESQRIPMGSDLDIVDFGLESDDSIIALARFRDENAPDEEMAVFQIDLDSGRSELVFDSQSLPRWGRVDVDPAGRVLISDDTEGHILRIDLTAGTEEFFKLPDGFVIHDMKIRVIPEPPTLLLILVGIFWLPGIVRQRQSRPAAECRR